MSGKRNGKASAGNRRSQSERGARQISRLSRVSRVTDKDIRAQIAANPDAAPELDAAWFARAQVKAPLPSKVAISFRVDRDVLEFFRMESPKYQSRMPEVLRAYVDHQLAKRGGKRNSR